MQTFFDAGLRVWIGDEINGFFVVVGWTDPAGSRSHIGALLLGYYTEDGRLHHAGRAGTGMGWPRGRWRVPPGPRRHRRAIDRVFPHS